MARLSSAGRVEGTSWSPSLTAAGLDSGPSVGACVRWLVAVCLGGAAVLHFAYAPSYFDVYWGYGVFFVGIAWLQAVAAVLVVLRPSRTVVISTLVINLSVLAVWVLSRTVGVGIGPQATVTQAVGYPDLLATILEALVVVGCLVLLAGAPALAHGSPVRWLTPLVAVSAAMFVAGSAAYAMTPGFAVVQPHPVRPRIQTVAGLTGNTPCEKAGPPVSAGQVLDSSGHFHRGPNPQAPLDEATRMELEAQQSAARTVVAKYPTVADALRAGYRLSAVYVPCIGSHYTNVGLVGHFDPAAPSELLYDGTQPTSRIVGLSYLVLTTGSPPDGFAGPNDRWHQHNLNGGLCINRGGVVIGAEQTTATECAARGGSKVPLNNVWMLHDWVVPGFDCSWGVFAAECPELGGRIGGSAWTR
jgi:hypothetical protein